MPDSLGRVVGAVLLVLAMSATCVMLGFWQWGRHEQKAAALAQVEAAWDAPVISLGEVLDGGLELSNDWQRVAVSGEFIPASSAVLRGRHVSGSPSTTVLGLLHASSGGTEVGIVVGLGWQGVDEAVPPLPEGPQDLVVRLRSQERSRGGTFVPGSVTEMNTQDILRAMGDAAPADLPVLQGYVQVVEAQPPLADFPDPEHSLGNNLSYAFQWWFFAAAIPVGAWLLVRRDRKEAEGLMPARTKGRAEEEEDAIIDAQLNAPSTR